MLNVVEVRKRIERFNKKALQVFTTALRMPLMFMMGCGYVLINDVRHEVKDDQKKGIKKLFTLSEGYVEYNEAKHGPLIEWLEEGEQVPHIPNGVDGKAPIHRHNSFTGLNMSGVHKYQYE